MGEEASAQDDTASRDGEKYFRGMGDEMSEIQQRLFTDPFDPDPYGLTQDDWYTPPSIVEPARRVLGSIDLDPASCPLANEVVKAAKYFTKDDDGLNHEWSGNVYCNPPYSDVDRWVEKTLEEVRAGRVFRAIFLCNASVDSRYAHKLLRFPVCFILGRVPFWHPEKETGRGRLGSMVSLIGDEREMTERFVAEFSLLGIVKI